jgi:hypothetical protein
MNSGKLLGLLFEPSEQEVRQQFTQVYGKKGFSTVEISDLIQVTLENQTEVSGFALAEISSTNMNYFGRQVPVFIVVNAFAVGNPAIRNDYDVRGDMAHELKHVEDWYDGISFGDLKVNSSSLIENAVSIDWVLALLELRADYEVLSLIDLYGKKETATFLTPLSVVRKIRKPVRNSSSSFLGCHS